MAYRYGGRLGVNQENEQRRLQREPVSVWKKEWVLPSNSATADGVKILKWVRTGDTVKFDQFEDMFIGEETVAAMEIDASTQPNGDLTSLPPAEDVTVATPLATADVSHEQDVSVLPPPVVEEAPPMIVEAPSAPQIMSPAVEVPAGPSVVELAVEPLPPAPAPVMAQTSPSTEELAPSRSTAESTEAAEPASVSRIPPPESL